MNALFLNALAQATAPEAAQAADPTGMYNLFVIIVLTGVFIAMLVAYIRSRKTMDNVAVPPIPQAAKAKSGDVPVAILTAAASAYVALRKDEDTALIAVLSAAAYVTLGKPVRVVSVQPVSTEWGVQGRRDIFLSHRIR